jgi:hypothetical protein
VTLDITNDKANWDLKTNLSLNIQLVPHGTLDTTLELSGNHSRKDGSENSVGCISIMSFCTLFW